MKIKKVKLEDIEAQVITGAITSKRFLKKVRRKLKPEHFKAVYGREILKWCFEYWDTYEKAPGQEIQRIFKRQKKRLKGDTAKVIKIYLAKLSEDYERQKKYNDEYLYDNLIKYIRKRDIENLASKLSADIENDNVERASKALVDFQLVHKETSQVFDPFSAEYINENFEIERPGILTLPDALGEMIGGLDRGWLVSFTAPEKRGKTWWLIEMAFQAMMQGRNVTFISFEMSDRDINERFWKRLTAGSNKEKVIVPVLDCRMNQSGQCKKEERTNSAKLLDNSGRVPAFKDAKRYKPCIYCKGRKENKDFWPHFWYEKVWAKEYGKTLLLTKAERARKLFGSSMRIKCFPAFTAGVVEIEGVIDELEVNEGYSTDVLITDYLDITAMNTGLSERGSIDATWKMAKGLAQKKSLLHITVDQSSKLTYERDVRLYDTSEDKRKNAHLDVKVGMNLLPQDVDFEAPIDDVEVLKFSVIAHRHKSFNAKKEVMILQQRGIGQPLIDCAWYKELRKEDLEDDYDN